MDVLTTLSVTQLYELRDHINCDQDYSIETKQQLMNVLTTEIMNKNLMVLMRPIVQEFIEEQENKL